MQEYYLINFIFFSIFLLFYILDQKIALTLDFHTSISNKRKKNSSYARINLISRAEIAKQIFLN